MSKLFTIAMLFSAITVFSGSKSAFATDSDCLAQIKVIRAWANLNNDQVTCLNGNADFTTSLVELCSQSKDNLSVKYTKYRKYEVAYSKEFETFRQATDPRARQNAQDEMLKIKRDWSILGFRDEVDQSLNLLDSAYHSCTR